MRLLCAARRLRKLATLRRRRSRLMAHGACPDQVGVRAETASYERAQLLIGFGGRAWRDFCGPPVIELTRHSDFARDAQPFDHCAHVAVVPEIVGIDDRTHVRTR